MAQAQLNLVEPGAVLVGEFCKASKVAGGNYQSKTSAVFSHDIPDSFIGHGIAGEVATLIDGTKNDPRINAGRSGPLVDGLLGP